MEACKCKCTTIQIVEVWEQDKDTTLKKARVKEMGEKKSLSTAVYAILLGTYFSISAICAVLQQLGRGASTLDRSSE